MPAQPSRENEHKTYALALPQFGRLEGTDVGLVSQDIQVSMDQEQFITDLQVRSIGRGQRKVQDHTPQGNEQVQPVAKDGLLLGGHFARGRFIGSPVATGTGYPIELYNGHGQA